MSSLVTIREFARLTTDPIENESLDRAQVSITAFDWLCKLNSSFSMAGAALVEVGNRRWLKMNNYVGVIDCPCGTRIEILPKHLESAEDICTSRALLRRMIQAALDLPGRDVGPAHLQAYDAPLNEWIISRFLESLELLVKRGIRFDYNRIEESQRFLRGQLNVAKQLVQPVGMRHYFQIRHDIFQPNRPENRLIKRAIEHVCKFTKNSENWRLSTELRGLLQEVPTSRDIKGDFKLWRPDRLMAQYESVKPWCELILQQQAPIATAGTWSGTSLLFPMERLFEKYVASSVRKHLDKDASLSLTPSSHALCVHEGRRFFGLYPDMFISKYDRSWVLDTKWKLIDQSDRNNGYGLKQSDFYQLFAYGKKYLGHQAEGDVILIYPKRHVFDSALSVFSFSESLRLWVLPFNLESGILEHTALMRLPVSFP